MTTLTLRQFIDKWKANELKEVSSAQSHFIDICNLVGHRAPTDIDTKGDVFTFEPVTDKVDGGKGRADVWYNAKFIWEYKRPHSNLGKAYDQLLLYRESLGNPPLLITSDTQKIIIHTNFTNTVKKVYEIDFARLLDGDGLDLLTRAFYNPQSFKPDQTKEQVTKATADSFVKVATTLQQWARGAQRKENPEQLAHFIIRLLFSLFAEDMKLLPDKIFSDLVNYNKDTNLKSFASSLRTLFAAMRNGGFYGMYKIPYFDGGLFDDDFVPELPGDILEALRNACLQDWSSIDPSILGTLFERIIDESKRSQLGLHYTSEDDIMLIVEPVLMQPLRHKWQVIKQQARELLNNSQPIEAQKLLSEFAHQIATTRVLDPACGSGNFLYVALRQLLDLQKAVIIFAEQHNLASIPLTVNPTQLYGIEINPYAHELAQTTVWIGYLQWRFDNGFAEIEEPILRPLHNIKMSDAILSSVKSHIKEPEWQEADVIIGNPPFLGGSKMRRELGDEYVEQLRKLYLNRVPGGADLVCYWFEKARGMLEFHKAKRAGLLATQSIRGGVNRKVLERIKNTGDIFMAWSDREWVQEGVMVHVSMVGFDLGNECRKMADGQITNKINADLTSSIDLTKAKPLAENVNICFRGVTKTGNFELTQKQANEMMASNNNSNCANTDVIIPSINALDITDHPRKMWLIDFTGRTLEESMCYEKPFQYVVNNVEPFRKRSRQQTLKDRWWLFERSRPEMREAISSLSRFIVTPLTSKYRVYVWVKYPTLPDQANYIFAREDDYFFGILHSIVHEIWVRRKGTQLREAESGSRYSPTETFETFPFPYPLGRETTEKENIMKVANCAHRLNTFRQNWLTSLGESTRNTIDDNTLKKRTLTNLYNALEHYRVNFKSITHNALKWSKYSKSLIGLDEIEELDQIHNELDHAVFDCYGWAYTLSDEGMLERLLALNLERSGAKAR